MSTYKNCFVNFLINNERQERSMILTSLRVKISLGLHLEIHLEIFMLNIFFGKFTFIQFSIKVNLPKKKFSIKINIIFMY